jgi:CRP-like cAMP-binding protein
MSLVTILQDVELFNGLTKAELTEIALICREKRIASGEVITIQGKPGDEMYIITEGFVQVSIRKGSKERTIVNLGTGQIFGEMALVDKGPRSATVKAISDPTVVQIMHASDFDHICNQNNHIGYIVMRNLASDISFKLRHRNLSEVD